VALTRGTGCLLRARDADRLFLLANVATEMTREPVSESVRTGRRDARNFRPRKSISRAETDGPKLTVSPENSRLKALHRRLRPRKCRKCRDNPSEAQFRKMGRSGWWIENDSILRRHL
jgi:hypothetical protein